MRKTRACWSFCRHHADDEMNSRRETLVRLVVPRRDCPELLDFGEKVLHQVPSRTIMLPWLRPGPPTASAPRPYRRAANPRRMSFADRSRKAVENVTPVRSCAWPGRITKRTRSERIHDLSSGRPGNGRSPVCRSLPLRRTPSSALAPPCRRRTRTQGRTP